MHFSRSCFAVTLCLALLVLAVPAAHAESPATRPGTTLTGTWSDWIQEAWTVLLPWTASSQGENRSASERDAPAPATRVIGLDTTCDPATTEHGCTIDPDG
ncbi:MAG: hypothetical protein PVG07_09135 [Acidobacteriota bacterium]|jgi:hypothetical protein